MNITINNPKVVVVRDSTSLTKQQQNINKRIDTLVHLAKQSVLSEGNYRTPRHVVIKQEQKCTKENQTPNVQMALVNEAFDIVNIDEGEVDNQMHQSEAKNGAIILDPVRNDDIIPITPAPSGNDAGMIVDIENENNDEDEFILAPSRTGHRIIVDNENADEERNVGEREDNKKHVVINSTDDAANKKRKPGRPYGTFRKKLAPSKTDFGIGECKIYKVDDSQNTNILEDFESQDFDDVDWDALGHKLLM
jgi:hypothetical protein